MLNGKFYINAYLVYNYKLGQYYDSSINLYMYEARTDVNTYDSRR